VSDSQDFRKRLAKMEEAIAKSLGSREPLTEPCFAELLDEYGVAGCTQELKTRLGDQGILVKSAWVPLSPNAEAAARNLIELFVRERGHSVTETMKDSDAAWILKAEGPSTTSKQHELESRRQQRELVKKLAQLESKREKCLNEIQQRDADLALLQAQVAKLEKNLEKAEDDIQTATSNSVNFAKYRLLSTLRQWNLSFSLQDALEVHATVLSQALTLVSNLFVVRAYEEALGDSARSILLPVSPAWMTFEDAWSGGLSKLLTRCNVERDTIFLATLYGLDCSLLDHWIIPILDLGRGGELANGLTWPANLRIFGIESGLASAPMHTSLSQLSKLNCEGQDYFRKVDFPEGQVTFRTWLTWVPEHFPAAKTGVF
jgi:hypothetical protein